MALTPIPFASLQPKPWKNGGGETMELAVFPEGAGFDDFDWRVSMARVASDGPFSVFLGIDRTLTLLDGAGLALRIDHADETVLRPQSKPVSFSGDASTAARLLDGPILDLNVMTRRGRAEHRVIPCSIHQTDLRLDCLEGFIVVREGRIRIDGLWLERFDALRLDACAPVVQEPCATRRAYAGPDE